ncbi:MAG: hypothetical protein ACTS8S_03490 [Giesbergeria sp.]
MQLAPEPQAQLKGYAWLGNLHRFASLLAADALLGDDAPNFVPTQRATLHLEALAQATTQQAQQSTHGHVPKDGGAASDQPTGDSPKPEECRPRTVLRRCGGAKSTSRLGTRQST